LEKLFVLTQKQTRPQVKILRKYMDRGGKFLQE